jgi:hypothetical protein
MQESRRNGVRLSLLILRRRYAYQKLHQIFCLRGNMARYTHQIRVTDNGTTITVDPVEKPIVVNDVVSWVLTPDSEPGAAIDILFSDASPFSPLQSGANENGGFGQIVVSQGSFEYTVTSADGDRRVDPIIIVNPVGTPPTQK